MDAYAVLSFTPEQIQKALGDLDGLRQLAVAKELAEDLAKEELGFLNELLANGSGRDLSKEMDAVLQKHQLSENFKLRARTAAETVLHDHIANLKTLGNDSQKQKLAAIFAEM